MRLYDDDATQRRIILHPTTIKVAVSDTFKPTGSSALMAQTHDSEVDLNTTLSDSKITTNRTNETIITQAHTFILPPILY